MAAVQDAMRQRSSDKLAVFSLEPNALEGLCNSADEIAVKTDLEESKILWFFRHGQSIRNVAREAARKQDEVEGTNSKYMKEYHANTSLIDACLTEKGIKQVVEEQTCVATWKLKPTLLVCSPLTRAIQTAAIIFEVELEKGLMKLVIRPELREYFAESHENRGRLLDALRNCPKLRALKRWRDMDADMQRKLERALSDDDTAEWREQWNAEWAQTEGTWTAHCEDDSRMEKFQDWLQIQPHKKIAIVSHWGVINNFQTAVDEKNGSRFQKTGVLNHGPGKVSLISSTCRIVAGLPAHSVVGPDTSVCKKIT